MTVNALSDIGQIRDLKARYCRFAENSLTDMPSQFTHNPGGNRNHEHHAIP